MRVDHGAVVAIENGMRGRQTYQPNAWMSGATPSGGARSEQGSALVVALALVAILGALGAGLAIVVSTESAIAQNFHAATRLRYASDAALELATYTLTNEPDWGVVLRLDRPATDPRVASEAPGAAWRLVLERSLLDVVARGDERGELLAAWVVDDPEDADGDESADSNGRLALRAVAIGLAGGRAWTAATIARDIVKGTPTPVRWLTWHALE